MSGKARLNPLAVLLGQHTGRHDFKPVGSVFPERGQESLKNQRRHARLFIVGVRPAPGCGTRPLLGEQEDARSLQT